MKMVMKISLALATCLAVARGVPLAAHHSFAAEFDDTKPVKVTGTLTKVEWTNSHIWFFPRRKNADGTVTTGVAARARSADAARYRQGSAEARVETVVVEGFRAKDGSNNASGGRITRPRDGRNAEPRPQDTEPGIDDENREVFNARPGVQSQSRAVGAP